MRSARSDLPACLAIYQLRSFAVEIAQNVLFECYECMCLFAFYLYCLTQVYNSCIYLGVSVYCMLPQSQSSVEPLSV